MFNKKAQADIKELALTLVIVGAVAIVGVLIFAKVSNSTESILDPTENTVANESVTITVSDPQSSNSTLLAQSGYIANSETVRNGTAPFHNLTRDVEYVITLVGPDGGLATRGNFTLLNVSNSSSSNIPGYNNSELFVSYRHNVKSAAQITTETINTTVLDSFELGVIALIVLAAVIILSVLFKLGSQ